MFFEGTEKEDTFTASLQNEESTQISASPSSVLKVNLYAFCCCEPTRIELAGVCNCIRRANIKESCRILYN